MDSVPKECSHTHRHIKEAVLDLKEQQNRHKFLINNLLRENKRLATDLRENVKRKDDDRQLEQMVEDAVTAKDAAVRMWKAALEQLEKQEQLLIGKKSLVATQQDESQAMILQLKEDKITGENILCKELRNSMDTLSRLKRELDLKDSDLEKCRADLRSACTELEQVKKKISELSEEEIQLKEKVSFVESSLSESNRSVDICKEKISSLTVENSELSATVLKLQEENKKLKSKILSVEKDAKESLRAAELAILEKQESISKEDLYESEIKMLRESIDMEKEKVSLKFKAEIKNLQKKSSEKIQQLMTEIENLHKEIGEKQSLFERANREKQALESKVDMLFSENSNGIPVSSFTFEDMCKRLTMAEKTRDELELKVISLETTLKEVKSSKEQEIEYLCEKYSTLNERFRNISRDFHTVSTDRVKLFDEVTQSKKKSSDLERELSELRMRCASNTATLETDLTAKLRNLQQQLQSTEEHYKSVCFDLQKLFEAEVGVSNKWQNEAEAVVSQSMETFKVLLWERVNMRNIIYSLINILHQNHMPVPNEILIDLGDDKFHFEPN